MSRALPRAVFAAALLTGPALAQDAAAIEALLAQAVEQAGGAPATPPPAGTPADSAAAAKPGEPPKAPPVLDTLKKATFTRLPADALREWSAEANPVPPPPAPEGAPAPAPDPGALAVDKLRKEVALGKWAAIGAFLKEQFPDKPEDAKQAWKHILNGLASQGGPGGKPQAITLQMQMQGMDPSGGQPPRESNILSPNDVLDLAEQCPFPINKEKDTVEQLGRLMAGAIDRGNVPDEAIARLDKGTANLGGPDPAKRRDAARLLVAAGLRIEAEPFLLKQPEAFTAKDTGTLNLLAMAAEGRFAKDGKPEDLEKAWGATQDALAVTEADAAERQLALRRAVELAPRVKTELGGKWLADSFTARPALGMEILAGIGIATGESRRLPDAEPRRQNLELQNRAVTALLKAAPERAKEWKTPLTLLAMNWLSEAEWTQARDTSTSRGPQMQFDMYGNVFFGGDMGMDMNNGRQGGRRAIPTGEMLTLAPGDAWLEAVDPSLRPALLIQLANLQLKVKMEKDAFPYIEKLAVTHPREARELADRFVEVWGENHDPNAEKSRTNRYMFIYGYNPQADGIPLTRSRQERNLTELAEWVKKLRALPLVGGLDEAKVAQAFMRTHSSAEVFRMDNITKVFGGLDQLKPETLAAILQTMRANLATVWRSPKEQQTKKTNRTDKEMEAEVARGYGVTAQIVSEARARFPEDWRLQLAQAALMLDQTNFANEKAKDSSFSKERDEAFAAFAQAAALYAKALPTLELKDQSADVFLTWFYASLGAADLEAVKAEQTPSPKQAPLIRAALEGLPGDAKERHETLFANALATRMTAAAPAVKHRYLSQGLPIAGDNERAREARQLLAYYADLVTEIRLTAAIDGPDSVGTEPFGVFVNIRHTTQIEREAGGFQKYLQNQNAGMGFYNFGRPPENYRDKFEEAAREALKESFEVMSVTFHADKVKSVGDPEDGWRVTPYCYLLLKAKGPQTDSFPPLKLNLDFMDTSGYAVLPIETNKLPLDAARSAPRPAVKIEAQEILDERKADQGLLVLEVKATARGLVPSLDTLFDLKPAGFDIEKIDDQGVRVTQLDTGEEHPENFGAPVSERLWNVSLKAAPGQSGPVKSFTFAQPKTPEVKALFMRYADADLVEVPATVNLMEKYGKGGRPVLTWTLTLAALWAVVMGWFYLRRRAKTAPAATGDLQAPEEINPITVMALLRRIRNSGRLQPESAAELDRTLAGMEAHYYAPAHDTHDPDLNATATEWLRRAAAV